MGDNVHSGGSGLITGRFPVHSGQSFSCPLGCCEQLGESRRFRIGHAQRGPPCPIHGQPHPRIPAESSAHDDHRVRIAINTARLHGAAKRFLV